MMKNPVRSYPKVRMLILFASLVVALSGVHILSAQAACDAGRDVAQGEMLYAAGSYEEAALAFHCVVENYEAWISYDKSLLMRHNNNEIALTLQSPATVSMLNGRTFTFPLYLQAGQNVSLSADSPETSGGVDTFLLVFDPVGQLVDYNDDRGYDNGDYNSFLTFTADVTGMYHAIVTHSGGNREGDVTVTLQDNAIR